MPRIFLAVVVIVALWLGATILFNPPRTLTPAEQLAALAIEDDHGASPHIAQLYGASAALQTRWDHGVAHYSMTLTDAQPDLVEWLDKKPNYSFIVTWYQNDKPAAQIFVPFAAFHPTHNVTHLTLIAEGDNKMTQPTYEKIFSSRTWEVSWGPHK